MDTYFPKGLKQPTTGHRFSIDSILLSCFVSPKKNSKIVDIGCGCGVISIGILLRYRDKGIKVVGIDIDREMIKFSQINAEKMKLSDYFFPVLQDIKEIKFSGEFCPEQFDVGVTNPPYRNQTMGRISPFTEKNPARFEQSATLEDFIDGAKFLLKNRARLYIVYLTERMSYLFSVLKKSNFEPKRLRFIHGKTTRPSKIFLLEAVKNGNPSLVVEPPLILYEEIKGQNIYTRQAMEFLGSGDKRKL